jgi:hypothetical protein
VIPSGGGKDSETLAVSKQAKQTFHKERFNLKKYSTVLNRVAALEILDC